jgi:uncharacterized membrane protein
MASYRKRSGGWRAEVAKLGVRDSQTFDTKAAAIAWATAREAEIIAQSGKSRTSVAMTLSEALRRYKRVCHQRRQASAGKNYGLINSTGNWSGSES